MQARDYRPEDKISKYFTYGEAIVSTTAAKLGISNEPNPHQLGRILWTAEKMDKVREYLGIPLSPTSWCRSFELNKAVGGSPTSDHLHGTSVDCYSSMATARAIYTKLSVMLQEFEIDQLILYPSHVHIGFRHPQSGRSPRHQAWVA